MSGLDRRTGDAEKTGLDREAQRRGGSLSLRKNPPCLPVNPVLDGDGVVREAA